MLTHAQRAKLETENEKLSVESFKEDTWLNVCNYFCTRCSLQHYIRTILEKK